MYGDKTTCRRKMKAEAKKWAKCYAEGRAFPDPKLIPILAGSVVFTDEGAANWVGGGYSIVAPNVVFISANPKEQGLHLQWRAYMLDELRFEASTGAGLPHEERIAFRRAFVNAVSGSAWGAISAVAMRCLFNSVEFTVPRIEGILRHWEALDTLKYIDFGERPISLTQYITNCFRGVDTTWVEQPTGDIKTDLGEAVVQMRKASDDEIYTRVLQCLRDYVDRDKDLKHPEWLKSPGIIEAELERCKTTNEDWYDCLTAGLSTEHRRLLRGLDRDYVPPAP